MQSIVWCYVRNNEKRIYKDKFEVWDECDKPFKTKLHLNKNKKATHSRSIVLANWNQQFFLNWSIDC